MTSTDDPHPPTASDAWAMTVETEADGRRVTLSGELDAVSGPLLQAGLVEALEGVPGPVVIDLAAVPFMDSTGLSALVAAHRLDPERSIRLTGAQPHVHRLLTITGLDGIFTVDPSD